MYEKPAEEEWAEVFSNMLAEAWDAGYYARWRDYTNHRFSPSQNPYRTYVPENTPEAG